MWLFLLLFFCPLVVEAETITTSYQYIGQVDQTYIPCHNEKVEVNLQYVLQEDYPNVTDNYYLEHGQPFTYPLRTNDYQYTPWSPWQEKRSSVGIEEERTWYCYQRLQSISQLTINQIESLLFRTIIVKNRHTDQIILTWQNDTLETLSEIELVFEQSHPPEDLVLEMTVFLWQDQPQGTFVVKDKSKGYIHAAQNITTKGWSTQSFLVVNCLATMQWDHTVICNDHIEAFYYKLVSEKQEYRYRQKVYRYQEIPQVIVQDVSEKKGYHLIDVIPRYDLYRKATIHLYDEIVLSDYLDSHKIILDSDVPVKELSFSFVNPCQSTSSLQVCYYQFCYEKSIIMHCPTYPKSRVVKASSFSWFRQMLGQLIKLSIEKIY